MARTATTRSIVFSPCSKIADFLGPGYTSQGVAQAPLANLLPIYPSPSLQVLAQLQRNSSSRNQRAGDKASLPDELAISVVMFKKFSPHVPAGLDVQAVARFFTQLFTFPTSAEKDAFFHSTTALLKNPHYVVMAITVPTFLSDEPSQLTHFIIAAALYVYDNKHGSYISLIGTTDVGDTSVCTLSDKFFIDPSNSGVLLPPNSSFRGHGLATFLLSTIQVLGHLSYKTPKNPLTSKASITCHEIDDDKNHTRHHLYLQARIEIGSAYVTYVKMGFITLAVENGPYRCVSYRDQCPVLASKLSKAVLAAYITGDHFLRLLCLKKWLLNVYPAISSKVDASVDDATNVWNARGLSSHEFLVLAVIPPLNNPNTRMYTNAAYLQLLKCRTNVGLLPLEYYVGIGDTSLVALPPDRTLSTVTRSDPGKRMIAGLNIIPSDIRRSLFRSLIAYVGDTVKFDAFQAIAASLYTEGKFDTGDQDVYCHTEMTLELRLNVVAFYRRCAHFAFTDSLLRTWSMLAGDEYEFAVENDLVTELGLSDFKGDLDGGFTTDRIEWNHNFKVLADRLSNANNTSTMQAPLWMDVYALQLLFFHHERPVIFATAYGFSSKQVPGRYTAHPQVATLPYLTTIDGLMVDQSYVILPLFIVVPIISLTVTAFGYLSHLPSNNPTDLELCQEIQNYIQEENNDITQFRTLPQLLVVGAVEQMITAIHLYLVSVS